LEPGFKEWKELIEFDAGIGWRPRASLNGHHLSDDIFHMTTDSEGWRGRLSIAESDIVVLGDSFAWGYGIDEKDFFANCVPDLKVKAIGTVGYNMVQELLWLKRLATQLQGKMLVWFVYYGNDLYENLTPDMCGYRMPFVREVNGTGDWEVVSNHVDPSMWQYASVDLRRVERNYYGKLAELCSETFLSERAYPACEFLLRQGRDVCKAVGARIVVMTIPETTQLSQRGIERLSSLAPNGNSVDPDLPDRRIREICARLNIPFVALKDHLNLGDYKTLDCHWNQRGHRRTAGVLRELYRNYAQKHDDINVKKEIRASV